jgi:hypothetical protein
MAGHVLQPSVEAARRAALEKAFRLEKDGYQVLPGDLDLLHYDPLTKESYKIVWEEKIKSSTNGERRIGIEEKTRAGATVFRAIATTCDATNVKPEWHIRSDWKDTYEEALTFARKVNNEGEAYAKKKGYPTPREMVAK